ncbi:MAG: T9SS type A sorting domain-containing protein [Sporocytophaga sp.]|uniref:malectin domain-containing carbohydrate-binding protein n=1 Tax=Sporocytophaga sp. TaxID=2231183 RepID=UPI001B07ACCD|nr:malectin domain-containing carbohydrate-binding protein [Sporocytophaga sp.]MBO9701277.1 T9SS type A sorting domain-containing protein [Sporocytophaga sp.]
MKKTFGTTLFFCFLILSELHSQAIDWVKPYEGEFANKQENIDVDSNRYLYESYEELTPEGWPETLIYLVKYDKNDVLIWKALLPEVDYTNGIIKIDNEGNIISVCIIDYYVNLLVSKFTPSGNRVFEVRADRNSFSCFIFPRAVSIDKDDNIYIAGNLNGFYQFGPFSLKPQIEFEDPYYIQYFDEPFLVKLNKIGQFKWGNVANSSEVYGNQCTALTNDALGNIYIGGYHQSDIDFQGETLHNASNYPDLFIIKYDSTGKRINALGLGTVEGAEMVEKLSGDEEGNVYLQGRTDFPFTLDSWSASESFLVKFSDDVIGHPIQYRINAGGPDISASDKNWEKDYQLQRSVYLDPFSSNHTTGSWHYWQGINTTGAPNALFGSNRYDLPFGGELSYNFPLANGIYRLSLFFAEKVPGVNQAGVRSFDVNVEDEEVLSNYDIFASVGLNADKKNFYVKVTDGVLNIDFIRNVGNPQVNGIEIASLETETSFVSSRASDNGLTTAIPGGSKYNVSARDAEVLYISSEEESMLPVNFKIYDMQGKLVYEENLSSSDKQFRLDTKQFGNSQQGLYLININNEEIIKMIK